jgi:hypothetical protein
MAKIILTGDGQSFELEDEIAKDDSLLTPVVKSMSPAYTNPIFRRETKGDVLTVHVSKQAGTKGGAIEVLSEAEESRGAVARTRERMDALARRRRLSVNRALEFYPEVEAAVAEATNELNIIRRALNVLSNSQSVSPGYVPEGF